MSFEEAVLVIGGIATMFTFVWVIMWNYMIGLLSLSEIAL